MNEHYHSSFGAIQESQHIFINHGFAVVAGAGEFDSMKELRILEVGFGTGLNALLTLAEAERRSIRVRYTSIEPFPIEAATWQQLNYPRLIDSPALSKQFETLHLSAWNHPTEISDHFILEKINSGLQEFNTAGVPYHLIYFDAFGPDVQPELWTPAIFERLYACLLPGGILVTYSVKGSVIRALKSAGFKVEKLPGPPGKRHITRAIRPPQVFATGGI